MEESKNDKTRKEEVSNKENEQKPKAEKVEKVVESTDPKVVETSTGIPKKVWMIGGGCIIFAILAVIIALYSIFGARYFGGGDPIANLVPEDTLIFVNLDLLKFRSDDLFEIVTTFQDVLDLDESDSMIETMDEALDDEYDLSFTDDIMPWIGQYCAFAIVDGDLDEGEVEWLFIIEALDKKEADEFLETLADTLEDEQGLEFDTDEEDGILLYIGEPSYGEDTFFARVGKYIYISNSDDAIFDSKDLKKKDSLAKNEHYQNAVGELSNNRLAAIFFGQDLFEDYSDLVADELYWELGVEEIFSFEDAGVSGLAMSLSVEDVGLRLDASVSYDSEELSDYQKKVMGVKNQEPRTDELVPVDTFFYLATRRSEGPGSYLSEDNPLYSSDAEEALELFDDEFGIDLEELFTLLDGEFGIAVAPAKDGLISDFADIDIGFTIIASVNDEEEFLDWFEDVFDPISDELGVDVKFDDIDIEDIDFQEVLVDDGYEDLSLMYFGVDNGYFIAGTSEDMLEDGLSKEDSLADNKTYRNTWKAFPSGSTPYLYLDLLGIFEFIEDAGGMMDYASTEVGDAEDLFEVMPVFAMTINEGSKTTNGFSMILFINTEN